MSRGRKEEGQGKGGGQRKGGRRRRRRKDSGQRN